MPKKKKLLYSIFALYLYLHVHVCVYILWDLNSNLALGFITDSEKQHFLFLIYKLKTSISRSKQILYYLFILFENIAL